MGRSRPLPRRALTAVLRTLGLLLAAAALALLFYPTAWCGSILMPAPADQAWPSAAACVGQRAPFGMWSALLAFAAVVALVAAWMLRRRPDDEHLDNLVELYRDGALTWGEYQRARERTMQRNQARKDDAQQIRNV